MSAPPAITMLPPDEAAALLGSGPIPSYVYTDPEWWEWERRAIFMRTWLHIGHICEVPDSGHFIRRDVEFARASLLIMRGKDGIIRTFHNVCTHRGTQLTTETEGKTGTFTCPYHAWTYGSDGALLSAPDFGQFGLDKKDCGLKQLATEVVAGMIFINFDPAPAQTAREFFGAIADEMEHLPVARATHFTEWTYEINANWKLNYDNFLENYHLRFIHPRTGAAALTPENPFAYPSHYGFLGPHCSQTLARNPNPPDMPPVLTQSFLRGAQSSANDGFAFGKTDFKLFPCFHIVGLPPNQYSHTHWPCGPDKTRGQVRLYWARETDTPSRAFAREFATHSTRDVLAEDRLAVEAGQIGLSARANSHVHFQKHEMLLRHMHETVMRYVADYQGEQS
jgi:phenylpropionate dioxygenase-like ring-hydroxylating dioxygenase large terminal subunit